MPSNTAYFRIEGPWTGWRPYTIASVDSCTELIDLMSHIDTSMVQARNFPEGGGGEIIEQKTTLRDENFRVTSYEIKAVNNGIYLYTNESLKLYLNLRDHVPPNSRFNRAIIIPAFRAFALRFDSDESTIYKYFSFDGQLLGSSTNDVIFYQIKDI